MNIKTRKVITNKANEKASSNRLLKVDFSPELNGSYRIKFSKEYSGAGFAVLLKGGMFHRFPDGFVVTKEHCRLLDEENIPYSLVEN